MQPHRAFALDRLPPSRVDRRRCRAGTSCCCASSSSSSTSTARSPSSTPTGCAGEPMYSGDRARRAATCRRSPRTSRPPCSPTRSPTAASLFDARRAAAALLPAHAAARLRARRVPFHLAERHLPPHRRVLVPDDRRDHDLLRPRLAAAAVGARVAARAAVAAPAGATRPPPALGARWRSGAAAPVRCWRSCSFRCATGSTRPRQLDRGGASLQLAHEAAPKEGDDDHGHRPDDRAPLADRSGRGPDAIARSTEAAHASRTCCCSTSTTSATSCARGHREPMITVDWRCSLNGAPPQPLVDPTVNLAERADVDLAGALDRRRIGGEGVRGFSERRSGTGDRGPRRVQDVTGDR